MRVGCVLLLLGSQGLDLGHQAWQQVPCDLLSPLAGPNSQHTSSLRGVLHIALNTGGTSMAVLLESECASV